MICVRCAARWLRDPALALRAGWGRFYHEQALCPACTEALGYAPRWSLPARLALAPSHLRRSAADACVEREPHGAPHPSRAAKLSGVA